MLSDSDATSLPRFDDGGRQQLGEDRLAGDRLQHAVALFRKALGAPHRSFANDGARTLRIGIVEFPGQPVAVEYRVSQIARRQTVAGAENAIQAVRGPLALARPEAPIERIVRTARGAEDDAVARQRFHGRSRAARRRTSSRRLSAPVAIAIEIEQSD